MGKSTVRVTPEERITVKDYRTAVRAEMAYSEDSGSSGWTWVAAIVIAAMFIVSGYLDQESGMFETASTAAAADKYASNSAGPQAPSASVVREKGY